MGRLSFTAVYAEPASWAEMLSARFSQTEEVVPADEVKPSGISQEQLNQINQHLMDESKLVAEVVALRAAGYDARVTGQGAVVLDVIPDMPADGVLEAGDIIVGVDGQPVETAVELVELVRRHQVGDQVQLTVVRAGERMDLTVGTRNSGTEPGRPVVGVSISTQLFDAQLPFPIEIDTDSVGGPSAGLMFALGLLDAATDGDLTRGYPVAGTGTIAADGTVGPIGGAAEKVIAAERDGARVFFVPKDNQAEAARGSHSVTIVPVERLDDAVRYLCDLQPLPGTSEVQPSPCSASPPGGAPAPGSAG